MTFQIEADDSYFYCGTSTGDIMAVNMSSKIFQGLGPKDKEKFSLGVTALSMLSSGDLLVGAGDGNVAICKGKSKEKGELTFMKARYVVALAIIMLLIIHGREFIILTN